jgi:hypothetical protein
MRLSGRMYQRCYKVVWSFVTWRDAMPARDSALSGPGMRSVAGEICAR